MLKELALVNLLFIVTVISDCPYVTNTDIAPCICLNNQIRCEGKNVTDQTLRTVFEKVEKSRPSYLKWFEGLELYDTSVTHIQPQIFGNISLRSFAKFNNNPIVNLSLGNFAELVHLDITGNKLENLTFDTFLGLKSLRYLLVGANNIQTIAKDAIAVLDSLERIDLSGNRINKLVYDLFSAEYDNSFELTEVDLSFNNLTRLPDNIFWPLRRPTLINLAHNRITNITANVFSFNEDVWFYDPITIVLSENGLMAEHFRNDTFKHIEKQKIAVKFVLSHNNITHLNESVFAPLLNGNSLSTLDVSNNPIKCGDCVNKWIITDPTLKARRAIIHDHCTDDVNRNIFQFNQTDFTSC